jgi:hypothetical protein
MKTLFAIALIVLFVAPTALADFYGWENFGTILGSYGNLTEPLNVTGAQVGSQGSASPPYTCPGAYEGTRYLHVAEDPHASTPYAIIAWVTNCADGDSIYASFYGYDVTPGASPSLRIWGGYTDGLDPNNYLTSAGSTGDYTPGDPEGWGITESTWTFNGLGATGLAIQARLYSTPSTSNPDHTDFWIDAVTVVAPAHCVVHFPEGGTPVENESWTNIKALYR